ncbi:hydroxymethylbilane synthase [Pseudogemmatithrix spongiicola]|uniref:Porphobilinogen deaminase n=1 Tax=Pseudogemmatithrix spongiicola TaxID=3062599 RepID=A0AA49JXE9_9BACT|nr:hydroxymethylbilane synthase [Gemmatimonadaceae bacterium 'strain 138']WKW13786.1 hydroxymethylbilane synthase [Gemmatimonadaceae bacterium 'strain 318']
MAEPTRIVIGTRASKLALWQSHHIRDRLLGLDPSLDISLERISTRGDEVQDRPLAAIGRNSLFVAEIEDALRSGRIRIAVHSAKDLPSTLPAEFAIVAFTTRADPRDVLVSKHGTLMQLPQSARVGTSSPRRACQLKAIRPDIVCLDIRGNVDTRLAKLERGDYDAIVLAAAGLDRLGWSHVATERLEPDVMLPAVAQGILAVEARADDAAMATLCAALEDPVARACAVAERAFLAAMGAGCNAPLAGFATLDGDTLSLSALVGAPDGRHVKVTRRAPTSAAATLGVDVADALRAEGGAELLAAAIGGNVGG